MIYDEHQLRCTKLDFDPSIDLSLDDFKELSPIVNLQIKYQIYFFLKLMIHDEHQLRCTKLAFDHIMDLSLNDFKELS